MLKIPVCNRIIGSEMELDISSSTMIENEKPEESRDKARDKSHTILKTAEKTEAPVYNYRQNHVSTVMLAGVPIVSLHIDGKERLCLAQISNTLLKQFSYNEIHNRRVALGITCVQCTPVQLEILRRAGAMPISSRRCGMITNREAERLVKSFLEDNRPPKLPDNFYFDVQHACGWGSRGKFEPSRYNSSRAKCIKCNFCNLFFSPNKFIFHFHRTPESKYNHPDAANFNSWRRHLTLVPGSDSDDISHAWEDVKAMFNGGSRKRMLSSPAFQESHRSPSSSTEIKKPKIQMENNVMAKPTFGTQYQNYPMFSMPSKSYPFNPLASPNPLALQYQIGKTDMHENAKSQALSVNPWRSPSDFIIPSYDLLWANQFNMRSNSLAGFRSNYFTASSPVKDMSISDKEQLAMSDTAITSDEEDSMTPLNVASEKINSNNQRLSAFRPVLKSGNRDASERERDVEIDDHTDMSNDIDIEDDSDVDIDDNYDNVVGEINDTHKTSDIIPYSPDTSGSNNDTCIIQGENSNDDKDEGTNNEEQLTSTSPQPPSLQLIQQESTNEGKPIIDKLDENDINSNTTPHMNLDDLNNMSKEELQTLLQSEMDIRKQVESDINKIKEGLQEQVSKEKSQRDEIAKQLQAMKDALCNELEQERKIRFTMQQKLKEAHDALHNFSCKMLASRQCAECAFKEAAAAIPR